MSNEAKLLGDGTWNDEERVFVDNLEIGGKERRRRHLAGGVTLTQSGFDDLKEALLNPKTDKSRKEIAANVLKLKDTPDEILEKLAERIRIGDASGWAFELVDDKQGGKSKRKYFEIWKYQ